MASFTWTSGKKGSWGTASDWAGGTVANSATADVTIAGTGSNVTIGSSNSYTVDSLTLGSGAPDLTIGGTLDFAGVSDALSLQSGLLDISGTLIGATIAQTGGTLELLGATWENVTDEGVLNLTASENELFLAGGDSFTGAGGTGPGTINLTGFYANIFADDNATLNNATVNFGAAGQYDYITLLDNGGPVQVLTLGTALDVVQAGTGGVDQINLNNDTGPQATLVNLGTIAARGNGADFEIAGGAGDTFSNQGSIVVSNGDDFVVLPLGSFANSGTIRVSGAGSSFGLEAQNWSNTGSISVSAGAALDLGGTFGLSAVSGIGNTGGTVGISGTLLDTGTLVVGTSAALGEIALSGTIAGGAVLDTGAGLQGAYGELDNVTYEGALDLDGAQSALFLAGSTSFTGTSGTGPGTINLTGDSTQLYTDDNFTLNNAIVSFGAAEGYNYIYLAANGGPVLALTLGRNLDVVQSATASVDQINLDNLSDGQATLVNQGTINAGAAQGDFEIYGPNGGYTFVNEGSIIVSNGDDFDMSDLATFSNTGLIRVGGTSTVFNLDSNTWSNAGAISVSGGAKLELAGTFGLSALSGITNTGGHVFLTGDLLNTGTLALGTATVLGPLTLSGTITGGTVEDAGGGLVAGGGVLLGVTYAGALDLAAANSYLYLAGANAFTGAAGTGPGVINLTGNDAQLFTEDDITLNNATLNIGGADASDEIYMLDRNGGPQGLTFGTAMVVVQSASGSNADIYADDNGAAGTVDNQGTIVANASGGYFSLYGNQLGQSFVNQGVIAISNGDNFDAADMPNFINTGLITATGAGTVLELGDRNDSATDFTNTGAISLSNGATLELGGTFGLAALSGITNTGGHVFLTGDLLNTGTLAVGTATMLGDVTLSGTITGGTVEDAGGGLAAGGGVLLGVTYAGALDLTSANSYLYLAGANVFTGAAGTGPGTINLTGNGAELFIEYHATAGVEQLTTLNDSVLNFGASNSSDYILFEDDGGFNALILGGGMEVVQSAGASDVEINLGQNGYGSDTLVNQGTIDASASGGDFTIEGYYPGDIFANQGTLAVTNGDIFDISNVTTFSNLHGTTLTGGAYEIGAGSTFQLAANSKIITDAASITLSGAGSVIEAVNSTTGTQISLDSKLASIATTGTLELLAGRNFAAAGSFSDSGDLTLGGVTFSAPALSITSTGTLTGAGTVDSAITDLGAIIAAGGSLVLTGALSGAGSASIEAGADLTLGTAATGGAITFAGTGGKLTLDAPASAGEQIVSLAPSDTIDIAGLTATSAAIVGGNLLISLSAGGTLDYGLANPNPADRFALSSDGHGGTDITVYGDADPEISPTTTSFGEQHAGALLTEFYTIGNENIFGAYQENLDAGFAGGTGGVTGGGSVIIAVQGSNSTGVSATLSSATGGLVTGTGTIGFDSDGNGIDGLGTLALPPEIVTLTGTFFNYAVPYFFGGTAISFGNVHAGHVPTDSIWLANAAAQDPYSENLDAGFVGASGNLITSGTVSELAAGSESFGLLISIGASNPGDQLGQATIALMSDGAGIDTLGTTALGFETINVSAVEYDYAAPSFATTIVTLGNVHVGSADSQVLAIANSLSGGEAAYQEGLDAYFSGTSGVLASGTVNLLGAGQIDSQDLSVGLATGQAGSFSGDAYLSLISDGAVTSQLGTTALPGAEIAVSGAVYAYAAPSLASTSINLGVIHVGDAGSAFLALSNAAADPEFTEGLDAGFAGSSGAVLATGAVNLLAAGGVDDSHLELILSTGASGTLSGTATLVETSDGALTSGLGTTSLGSQIITLIGTVDNFATLGVAQTGGDGTLTSPSGNGYELNLGSALQGGAALTADFEVLNSAAGLADLLGGSFTVVSASGGFSNTGLSGFTGLGAGAGDAAPAVTLSTATGGTFTEVLEIEGIGSNASGYSGAVGPVFVTITGTIASAGPEVFTLTTHADDFVGGGGNDTFIAATNCLSSGDILIGGSGMNTLVLSGGGSFDMTAPATLSNISQVLAVEAKGRAEQSVYLRNGFSGTLTAASGASGSGIFVYGNQDSATIILGNGNDTVYVGSDSEKISSGKGDSLFYVSSATAGATIAAGKGANTLAVTGGGVVQMGAAISGIDLVRIIDTAVPGTTFTANNTAGLMIDGGSGADTIILGAATQRVLAGGGATLIEATIKEAGAAITASSIGAVTLDLTTSGTGTLNAADTDLFVTLDSSSNLVLSKMGFVTADGAAGKDKLTAMAANQTLVGGASDTLIGYSGFGDLFKGTASELNGDTISLFGGSDLIDLTSVNSSLVSALHWTPTSKGGKLSVSDGTHSAVIDFSGTYSASDFTFASDGALGTHIKFV